MAKIEWTAEALEDLENELSFWIQHNRSDSYSKKTYSAVIKKVAMLAKFPGLGRPTNLENVVATHKAKVTLDRSKGKI